jgi:hypothetical protein
MRFAGVVVFLVIGAAACGGGYAANTAGAGADAGSASDPCGAGATASSAAEANVVQLATPGDYARVVWVGATGGRVYFSLYYDAIESEPSTGGAAPSRVSVASQSGPAVGDYAYNAYAFDSTYVYWAESGIVTTSTINRAPLAGGPPQRLATSEGYVSGLALDSGTVYWVDQIHGAIFGVPDTGGTVTTIATGLVSPAAMVVHAGMLYFSDGASVMSVPTSGGTVTTLVHGPGLPVNLDYADDPMGMAVDDDYVYFAQPYAKEPTIAKVPVGGGQVTVLARSSAVGMAVDANNVYWVTGTYSGAVCEVPIAGGAARVIASNQPVAVGPAVDDEGVYWATNETAQCGVCGPPTSKTAVLEAKK